MTRTTRDDLLDPTGPLVLALLRERLGTGAAVDAGTMQRCDWQRFERLAARHGLTCLLAGSLAKHADAVPPDLLRRMELAHQGNALRNGLLRELLDRVVAAFDDDGIGVLVLKGGSLIGSVYDDDGLRRLDDVDLLVGEGDRERADACLRDMGFEQRRAVTGRGPFCDIHDLYWDPDSPALPIELHWRLFEPYRPYRFDLEAVRAGARPLDGPSHGGHAMSYEHELAHLCLHLERHSLIYRSVVRRDDWLRLLLRPRGEGRLIWLYDVALSIQRHSSRIDWDRFVRDVERWSIGPHVHSVLELCRRALGPSAPGEVLHRLAGRPPGIVERLAHRLVAAEPEDETHAATAPAPRSMPWSRHVLRAAHIWTSVLPPTSYLRAGDPRVGPMLRRWVTHARSVLPELRAEARFRLAEQKGVAGARGAPASRSERERFDTGYPTVRPGLAFRVCGDELIAYDPGRDRTIVLNASAAAILTRCDGTRSVADIARDLAGHLAGMPQDATGEVVEALGRLRTLRLVMPSGRQRRTAGMFVTEEDRRAFAHHVYVDTTHRFVFFTIPKVACTEWMKLFMRMQGVDDWRRDPHHRQDRPLLSSFSIDECTEILTSPRWYKAAFFRDPVERLLSAYLDKLLFRKSYVIELFEAHEGDVEFDEFLSFVLDPNTDPSRPCGLHRGTNPHWQPQSMVGNLAKFAGALDFAGRFDHLREDAISLLRGRGLWDEYGQDGWGRDGRSAMFEANDAPHRTDAGRLVAEYFSPEQLRRVRHAYRDDYALFERLGLGDICDPPTAEP